MSKNMTCNTEMPLVIAIIVTWNKKGDVTQLLKQLNLVNYPNDKLEIVVVDNNSADGTVKAIETKYPVLKLIKNRKRSVLGIWL